jgi:hypothetical protein
MTALSPKQRAVRKVDIALVIAELQNAIVAARLIACAGPNTLTRETFALARAHTTAALGGIEVLQGEARKKPVAGEIETFLAEAAKRDRR